MAKICIFVSACDTTLFPGSPFPGQNSLTANLPPILPIGYPVSYSCADNTFELVGAITTNMCDDQGAYGPIGVCELCK